MTYFHRPELLAPGGDLQALQTAVRNGADAVYFGLSRFSARSSAKNITLEELPEALAFLHEHSSRGYLALNTLLRSEELPAAVTLAHEAFAAGIDAIIVQDIGLLKQLRQELPQLILHGSTQMSLGSAADLDLARDLGLQRLVLPRELSGTELAALITQAAQRAIETEAFIHGALCVCYSGQCLMSSLIGGRSGNRGACAQPCRLDYQLNGHEGALYSPRDQSLLPYLPSITRTPLTSLKIEGRMRGPAYVGQVVAVYREALDTLEKMVQDGQSAEAIDTQWPDLIQPGLQTLRLAFNRGGDFTQSYWQGHTFKNLIVQGLPGSHGVRLGEVARIDATRGNLWIDATADLKSGDVVAIRRSHTQNSQTQATQAIASAPLGSVQREGSQLLIKGFHPEVLREIRTGDTAFRMNDAAAEQVALKADWKKTILQLSLSADSLTATVLRGIYSGKSVRQSYLPDPALNPISPERAAEQLKKTGGTAYRVESVQLSGEFHLTIGQLNQMRRDCLEQLSQKLNKPQRQTPEVFNSGDKFSSKTHLEQALQSTAASQESCDEVIAFYYQLPANPQDLLCGADCYELPLLALDRDRMTEIARVIKYQEPNAQVVVHWPAIATGEKAGIVPELIADLKNWPIDGVCSSWPQGNFALKVADSTANLMNNHSFEAALQAGATVLSPSLELNGEQLAESIRQTEWPEQPFAIERSIYGRLRLMTTAYCPIGKNAEGCRKCLQSDQLDDSRIYNLIDRKQHSFKIVPHPRICQAEMLNSDLLFVPEEYSQLRHLLPATATWRTRLFFSDETPTERQTLTQATRAYLANPNNPATLETLTQHTKRIANRLDTRLTSGHYQRGVV